MSTTVERRGIKDIEVFAPSIRVRFHQDGASAKTDFSNKTGGAEQDLVSCQTYKDIGQPAGTFMVHLADHRRYDNIIKPMDLCTINISAHTPLDPSTGSISLAANQHTHATMMGFVDSVRRKRLIDPTTGRPQVFCEIRGRDFGKLLVKHQVRYLPWLMDRADGQSMVNPVLAMFKQLLSGFSSGGEIDALIINNLRNFFQKTVSIDFPFNNQRIKVQDGITYRAMADMGVIPYNLPLQAQEGSLWQILQNYGNIPFNELWVDTVNAPERVINANENSKLSSPLEGSEKYNATGSGDICNAYTMLFFRRTPFGDTDWKALPRYNISNSDVYEQDLGLSDHEVYNFFWVYPLLGIPQELALKGIGCLPIMLTKDTQYQGVNPSGYPQKVPSANVIDLARVNSVEKYGFNPLELKTRVWAWSQAAQVGGTLETCNRLTATLNDWFRFNSRIKSGSLTIKGAPDLHVGNVLRNVDEGEEYYVEGVANNYVQYQPLTTTVMLTRGQPYEGKNRFVWGDTYRDYCKKRPLGAGKQQEIVDALNKSQASGQ